MSDSKHVIVTCNSEECLQALCKEFAGDPMESFLEVKFGYPCSLLVDADEWNDMSETIKSTFGNFVNGFIRGWEVREARISDVNS